MVLLQPVILVPGSGCCRNQRPCAGSVDGRSCDTGTSGRCKHSSKIIQPTPRDAPKSVVESGGKVSGTEKKRKKKGGQDTQGPRA